MNEPAHRPSGAALVTEALFSLPNIGLLLGGLVVGTVFWLGGFPLIRTLVWLGTVVAYASRVTARVRDPVFIAQVARESDTFEPPGGGQTLFIVGPYQRQVQRVMELTGSVRRAVKALPEGLARTEFMAFLPRLEDLQDDVSRLGRTGARLRRELDGAAIQRLTQEVAELDGKIEAATDEQARQTLVTARGHRREALTRYEQSERGLARLDAQLDAAVGALEEVKGRVLATSSDPALIAGTGAGLVKSLDGVCKDVKCLSESLEETTKLLT